MSISDAEMSDTLVAPSKLKPIPIPIKKKAIVVPPAVKNDTSLSDAEMSDVWVAPSVPKPRPIPHKKKVIVDAPAVEDNEFLLDAEMDDVAADMQCHHRHQDTLKDLDNNHIKSTTYALDKLWFLYKKAIGDDKSKFHSLYQGAFVVQIFGAHFTAINSARKVERALTLVATHTLTIEMVLTAKGKSTIPLPKTLNHSTGKVSNQQTGFNDVTWGSSMHSYVKSIVKSFQDEKFQTIITSAKEFEELMKIWMSALSSWTSQSLSLGLKIMMALMWRWNDAWGLAPEDVVWVPALHSHLLT
ncbi:hypothetical protein EDB19DRAFT_1831434 [Suillus lakei]|nr:hypothetical protein EDB19DRAFT_1831434 [Suillus lakei]